MSDTNTEHDTEHGPEHGTGTTTGHSPATRDADTATIARMTTWARTTRLVPAGWLLVRVAALGLAVKAAMLALLLPGYAPAPLTWLADRLGVDASALSGRGWPVLEFLNRTVGVHVAAGAVVTVIIGGAFFLALRRGHVEALARLLRRR